MTTPKVQTSATLADEVAAFLHDRFSGTVAGDCEQGKVLHWEIDETFRSGRVRLERRRPRPLEQLVGDLEELLRGGFSGRLVLHCTDGAVVRFVRKYRVPAGAVVDLTEAAPSCANGRRSLS